MDDNERQHKPDLGLILGGQSAREAREAVMTPLQRAISQMERLRPQLANDPTVAYSDDFIAAAATYYKLDGQLYNSLYRHLKERHVRMVEFERRVRHRIRENEAAEKPAKLASPRASLTDQSKIELRDPPPWDLPVEGAALLDDIVTVITRFVVLPPMAAEAIALWILHTYLLETAQATPRLAITSPRMRCGKTRLIGIIGKLVRKALSASNISVAAVYRTIEAVCPTLLLDEADTFVDDTTNELRGILNSGYTRDTAFVLRIEGDALEPRQFSTWCPVAVAAIGKLPGTWLDRSIIIGMKRKRPSESVERFGPKTRASVAPIFEELARKCARWAADHLDALKVAEPEVPTELEDRSQEIWEPLLAIADAVGARWGLLARDAARTLSGAQANRSNDDITAMLIADLRDLYEAQRADWLPSTEIAAALGQLEDRPWKAFGKSGRAITTNAIARMLKPFEVFPEHGRSGNGYALKDLAELIFSRYLPDFDFQTFTPSQTIRRVSENGTSPTFTREGSENTNSPTESKRSEGVKVENGKFGPEQKKTGFGPEPGPPKNCLTCGPITDYRANSVGLVCNGCGGVVYRMTQ